jgi:hypothetical protein
MLSIAIGVTGAGYPEQMEKLARRDATTWSQSKQRVAMASRQHQLNTVSQTAPSNGLGERYE